jgi:hypothetical protein
MREHPARYIIADTGEEVPINNKPVPVKPVPHGPALQGVRPAIFFDTGYRQHIIGEHLYGDESAIKFPKVEIEGSA